MATLAIAVAGSMIGASAAAGVVAFGMTGAQLGWAAGMLAGQMLFSDQHATYGARVSDLQISPGAIGMRIPTVHGGARVMGGIMWATKIAETSVTDGSGKGGGGTQTTFSYAASFAVIVCKGPIKSINRIWADGKLIWNIGETSTPNDRHEASISNIEIYLGTEVQTPNSTIEISEGAGEIPAFLGIVYAVFTDHSLTQYGNRIPNFEFEVFESATIKETYSSGEITPAYIRGVTCIQHRTGSLLNVLVKQFNADDQDPGSDFTLRTIDFLTGALLNTIDTIYQPTPTPDSSGAVLYSKDWNWWFLASNPEQLQIKNRSGDMLPIEGGSWGKPTCVLFMDGDPARYISAWKDQTLNNFTIVLSDLNGNHIHHASIEMGNTNKISLISNKSGILYISDSSSVLKRVTFPGLVEIDNIDISIPGSFISRGVDPHAPDIDAYEDFFIIHRDTDGVIVPELYKVPGDNGESFELLHQAAAAGRGDFSSTLFFSIDQAITTRTFFEKYSGFANPSKSTSLVISDIAKSSGLLPENYDVSGVVGSVGGLLEDANVTARSVLSPLMDVKHLMAVESGNVIKFTSIKKENALAITEIEDDDLGAGVNASSDSTVVTSISSALDTPVGIQLEYKLVGIDYKKKTVRIKVNSKTVPSLSEKTFASSVLFIDPIEPSVVAERLLVSSWVERVTHAFSLPYKYIFLDPGDVISLPVHGMRISMRIKHIKYVPGEIIHVTAIEEIESLYESGKITLSSDKLDEIKEESDKVTDEIKIKHTIIMRLLDLPSLSDQDGNNFGFAVTAWDGGKTLSNARLFRSADKGVTWFDMGAIPANGSNGTITSACNKNCTSGWDMTSRVTVEMFGSELSSESAINVLSGANIGMIGNEIIKWRRAVMRSPGIYELSQLIRGVKGTKIAHHHIGSRFVSLSTRHITLVNSDIWTSDSPILYKIVREGQPIQEASETSELKITNGRIKPFPGCHPRAIFKGGYVLIKWIPRSRFSKIMNLDSGMGEPSWKYIIEVMFNGVIIRTLPHQTEPEGIYLDNQRSEDNISMTDKVTYRIFHSTPLAGRGDYIEVTER